MQVYKVIIGQDIASDSEYEIEVNIIKKNEGLDLTAASRKS